MAAAATANGSVRLSYVIFNLRSILYVLISLQGRNNISILGDTVDTATFDQILEMDDDEDRDFSKEIVYGFFEQAETTFVKMDEAMYVLSRISITNPSSSLQPQAMAFYVALYWKTANITAYKL